MLIDLTATTSFATCRAQITAISSERRLRQGREAGCEPLTQPSTE